MTESPFYSYLHDHNSVQRWRFLTLAIKLEGTTAKYGFSLNASIPSKSAPPSTKGDQFNARLGRKIALERLNLQRSPKNSGTVEIVINQDAQYPERSILRQVAKHLAQNSTEHSVRQICRWLEDTLVGRAESDRVCKLLGRPVEEHSNKFYIC